MENIAMDFTELKNAIVIQAVMDYRYALIVLSDKTADKKKIDEAKSEIASLERFFYSDWYSQLTKVDPNYLLERIRKEVQCCK